MWLGVDKERTLSRIRNVHHSRLNSQHNCRDLYDLFMCTRVIFTLMKNKIFIWAPKITSHMTSGTPSSDLLSISYYLPVSYREKYRNIHVWLISFHRWCSWLALVRTLCNLLCFGLRICVVIVFFSVSFQNLPVSPTEYRPGCTSSCPFKLPNLRIIQV
jgi:hypothetical protein